MAHIEQFKRDALPQMGAHWRRLREAGHYGNDNIDPDRTGSNYALGGDRDVTARVAELARAHEEAAGRALRKDAVVAFDVIDTLPRNWPTDRDPREFFEACRDFNRRFFCCEELLAVVHVDETTPHLHHAFAPVDGDGRFSFSRVVPRERYRRYHAELESFVRDATGVRDLAVLLPEEERGRKALSSVGRKHLDEAARLVERAEVETRRAEEAKAKAERGAARARRNLEILEGDTSFTNNVTGEKGVGIKRAQRLLGDLEAQRAEAERARDEALGAKEAARAEAEGIKKAATIEAERLKAAAQAEAHTIKADARAEAEGIKEAAEAEAEGIVEKARVEANRLLANSWEQLRKVVWPLVRRVVRLVEQRLDAYRRQPTPEDIDAEAWDALVEVTDGRWRDEQER